MALDEEALRRAFKDLLERVAYLEKASQLFASDKDLAGPHGDPIVRFDPKSWRGPSQKGKKYSACPADFLEQLAEALAWAADNPQVGKEKYAAGNRTDARRARSYARRARLQAGNQGGQGGDKSGPPANGQRPATTAGRPASSGRPSARRPGAGAPTESTAQPAHQDPGSGQQDPADDFLGGAEPPGDDDFLGGGDSPGP